MLEYHPQEGWSVMATSLERDSCLSPAFSRAKAITLSSQLLPGTLILTLSSKTGMYSHLVSACALHEEGSGNVEWALKRTKMKVVKELVCGPRNLKRSRSYLSRKKLLAQVHQGTGGRVHTHAG